MASLLSSLVNSLAKEIHKTKFKYGHDNKKCKTFWIKYKDCGCCPEYTNIKNNLIEYKCLCCNKNNQKRFDENLKKDLLIHINLVTMISISLFYCCKKLFTNVNIWMIGKNSMK